MRQQNIANIILYDVTKRRSPQELEINSNLISEVVEGWNRDIYVFPSQSVRFQKNNRHKYVLM